MLPLVSGRKKMPVLRTSIARVLLEGEMNVVMRAIPRVGLGAGNGDGGGWMDGWDGREGFDRVEGSWAHDTECLPTFPPFSFTSSLCNCVFLSSSTSQYT